MSECGRRWRNRTDLHGVRADSRAVELRSPARLFGSCCWLWLGWQASDPYVVALSPGCSFVGTFRRFKLSVSVFLAMLGSGDVWSREG